jgi:hypothetical protein
MLELADDYIWKKVSQNKEDNVKLYLKDDGC